MYEAAALPLELGAEAVPPTEQQERGAEPGAAPPPAAAAAAGPSAAREGAAAPVQVSAPRPHHVHAAARPNTPGLTPPPPAALPSSPPASQAPGAPPPAQQAQPPAPARAAPPQPRQAWDCSANRAAHAARMAAAALQPGSPAGRSPSHRAWAGGPPTPFAALSHLPGGGSPTQPRRPAFSLPRAQLPRSPFGAVDLPGVSAAVPILAQAQGGPADRAGSLHEVNSLMDWAAVPASPLGPPLPERVPSLQDWMMPLAPAGSLPRQPSLRERPIPEAGIAPADPPPEPSLLCGEQLGARPPAPHAGGGGLNRPAASSSPAEPPGALLPAHPPAAGRAWPGRRPAAPRRANRGASVSPKRDRNSLDEEQGVPPGSCDDSGLLQPPKSPRLGRRAGSIGSAPLAIEQVPNQADAASPVRAGSALGGTGFADFHAVIDNIWAGPNDVRKPPAGGESPWVG